MADPSRLPRSLWGVDPHEAVRILAEQEESLRQERASLEQAVLLAEAEAEQLAAECAHLEEGIGSVRQRLAMIQQGLERQRLLGPAQALALRHQMAALEREHSLRIEQIRRREAELRAEIEERRRSLHSWALSLLRSVAERAPQPGSRE